MSCLREDNLRNRWTKNAVSHESSVGAFDGDRMVGFTAVDPAGTNIVKLVNADHGDPATAALLEKTGFEIYARQYEMELEL